MARRITAVERMNVLLEDIKTQNRVTYEALSGQIEGLERRLCERFDRLEERVTVLENAVRMLFEEVNHLRSEVNGLRAELNELRVDVNKLQHDFDNRSELARLEALEERVSRLEKRRTR